MREGDQDNDGCMYKKGNMSVSNQTVMGVRGNRETYACGKKTDARGCLLILSGHLLAVRNGENQEGEKMERVMLREIADRQMTWVPLRAMWLC